MSLNRNTNEIFMMAAAGENFQNYVFLPDTKISIALLYYYRVNEIFFLGDFRRKLNFSPNFRRF